MQRRLIAGREIGGVKSALRGSQRQTDAGEGDGRREGGHRENPTGGGVGSAVFSTCADGYASRARARARASSRHAGARAGSKGRACARTAPPRGRPLAGSRVTRATAPRRTGGAAGGPGG